MDSRDSASRQWVRTVLGVLVFLAETCNTRRVPFANNRLVLISQGVPLQSLG